MSTLTFAETHNIVAFLEKPVKSKGFHEIIDFLNANQIRYALTVNPTIYTSCVKQFWTTSKIKTINQEVQIQALIDGKKVIVTEVRIRHALHLQDDDGTECLPNATIFSELQRMGFVQVFINKQVDSLSKHKETYDIPSHSKKIFANMRRKRNKFSGRATPLFPTMLVQAQEVVEEGSVDFVAPIESQPSTSQSQPRLRSKKKSNKKTTKVSHPSGSPIVDVEDKPITHTSNDPQLSGEDRLKLTELMDLCTKLSDRVLALETEKIIQALEIASLKKQVKKLEKKVGKRTHKLKRLNNEAMDDDNEVMDDYNEATQENDNLMFDIGVLEGKEVVSTAEKEVTEVTTAPSIPTVDIEVSAASLVSTALVVNTSIQTTSTIVTTVITPEEVKDVAVEESNIPVSATTTTTVVDTATKEAVVSPTIATTTATTTVKSRPKEKGVVLQEPSEFSSKLSAPQSSQLPQAKDKGKAIMIEPENPLKPKDQIKADEQLARELAAEEEEDARLEREEAQSKNKPPWI
ncbi:hypothetical protein Tco_0145621 [Tanacetum coccineum]